MTINDLNKLHDFLNRLNNLPSEIIEDSDFKSILADDQIEKERLEKEYFIKRNQILGILDELLFEIRAFIKLKFGIDSEYMNGFNLIHFDSTVDGFVMNTFNINHNKYWLAGRNKLYSILKNIEAEIKINLATTSDELNRFKNNEEQKLKRKAKVIFLILSFLIPFFSTFYFIRTLINWKTLELFSPLTWVNNENFGKLEFLIIVFEIVILSGSIFIYKKYHKIFTNWYYNKYKLKENTH